MECGAFFLCLSVSMSVSVWGGGYSWLREVTGGMGATFCHLAAPRSAIEFLFWIIGKRPFWAKS